HVQLFGVVPRHASHLFSHSTFATLPGVRTLRIAPVVVVATGLVLVVVVALIDYVTPPDVRLYPLYFVPVSFVSWYTRRSIGVALSVLASAAWTASNHFGTEAGVHPALIALNAALILASFLAVSLLISGRRTQFERVRELARSDALTGLANRRAFEELLRLE